jgi:hypothetical protein
MATVVMPHLTSHCAILFKSSVKVENIRTGSLSRSGGAATKISLAPILMPAAFWLQNRPILVAHPFSFSARFPWQTGRPRFAGCGWLLFLTHRGLSPFSSGNGQVAQKCILLTGISLGDCLSRNHCMAHENWDHAP